MDYLGRCVVEEYQLVTVQNRPLIGSQLLHWIVTLYGYTPYFYSFSTETFNT
jgi:hypothetical protein